MWNSWKHYLKYCKYYEALIKKERENILETLSISLEENEKEYIYQKNILYFQNLTLTNSIFLATYQSENGEISKQYIISNEKIKYYLHTPNFYTKQNKELIDNYNQSIINYQEQFRKSQKNQTRDTS